MELAFHWQGVSGCLCGAGPHDSVPVTSGSGRLKRVERWGQKLRALAGVVTVKMASREVMVRGLGENPWDSVACMCRCQHWA